MAEVTLPEGWSSFVTGCATCPDDTLPGAQTLAVVHCYDITGGVPDGTISSNNAAQMNYVSGNPETFMAIVTDQSGFAVNYPLSTSYQAVNATGETLTGITALPLPGSATATFVGQTAGCGRQGKSDERSVYHTLSSLSPTYLGNSVVMAYFSYDTNTVTYLSFPISNTLSPVTWAKKGDRFWHPTTSPNSLVRWSIAAGGAEQVSTDISAICSSTEHIMALHASENFLYMLIRSGVVTTIYQLDLDLMTVQDSWSIHASTPNAVSMHVVDDDLIYIWNVDDSLTYGFYYLVMSTDTVTKIGTVLQTETCTPAPFTTSGHLGFHFNKGYFYLTSGGFSVGAPNITKIGTLRCPGLEDRIGTI